MLLTWTTEFIQTALSTLNEQERSAIHLTTELNGGKNPGPVRLKKLGFENLEEYCATLQIARDKLKRWFAVWGIHRLTDLEFAEPGCSAEGKIQKAARARKT